MWFSINFFLYQSIEFCTKPRQFIFQLVFFEKLEFQSNLFVVVLAIGSQRFAPNINKLSDMFFFTPLTPVTNTRLYIYLSLHIAAFNLLTIVSVFVCKVLIHTHKRTYKQIQAKGTLCVWVSVWFGKILPL